MTADLTRPAVPGRVAVIGGAGAGKTTLATALAAIHRLPFVELDALFWGPGWTASQPEDFRARVAAALAGESWAADGNYGSARDLIWGRAETLVWLDYPLPLLLWRLIRRSFRRVAAAEELWHGNRETWRNQFLSRDSLLIDTPRHHRRRRAAILSALADPAFAHLDVVRLPAPRAAADFLAGQRALAGRIDLSR